MTTGSTSVVTPNQYNSTKVNLKKIVDTFCICGICLGDVSDGVNELIDCDKCGISVHEGCYGVYDSGSVSSSTSSCSTEPWFCEACKAGIENPTCELCPNLGGIFKETVCGKWVHLVCALYVPGVTFGEATSLSKIQLFKNAPPLSGKKKCTLCKDSRFSNTGVTIPCDAWMCRTSFHVTCAQQEGGLSDATSPETDPRDPFYGHCKLHVDKLLLKKRKRNLEMLQLRTKQIKLKCEQQFSEKSATWQRNQQFLRKSQSEYDQIKKNNMTLRTEPSFESIVPCSITTSASSCQAHQLKEGLVGINTTSQKVIRGQIIELRDVPKKWNVPPVLDTKFVSYFNERNLRLADLKNQLKHFTDQNNKLQDKHKIVQEKYNQDFEKNEIQKQKHLELENIIKAYHKVINLCNPNANISDEDILTSKFENNHNSFKKKKHEQHRDRNSSEIKTKLVKSRKRKHKLHGINNTSESESSNDTTDEFIDQTKSIPNNSGKKKIISSKLIFGSPASAETSQICTKAKPKKRKSITPIKIKLTHMCCVCRKFATTDTVQCDECSKYFHFCCLQPPMEKTPKARGYAWHCELCDSTDSDFS